MPEPLSNPPTHEQQLQLRERMLAAEGRIAAELRRFEVESGVRVRCIELVRYESGTYRPTLRLGAPVRGGGRG